MTLKRKRNNNNISTYNTKWEEIIINLYLIWYLILLWISWIDFRFNSFKPFHFFIISFSQSQNVSTLLFIIIISVFIFWFVVVLCDVAVAGHDRFVAVIISLIWYAYWFHDRGLFRWEASNRCSLFLIKHYRSDHAPTFDSWLIDCQMLLTPDDHPARKRCSIYSNSTR